MWMKHALLFGLGLLGFLAIGATLLNDNRLQAPQAATEFALQDPEILQVVHEINHAFNNQWQSRNLTPTPAADDLLIARRISLGLMGTVPSLEEIRVLQSLPPSQRIPWWLDHVFSDRRYGDYVAKLQIVPVSDNLISLTGEIIDASDRHDALREEVAEAMKTADGVWELRVQLLRDKDSMPIEDATVVWHEELSPFVAVARLTVPAQTGWSEAKAARVDDCMHFSPWNGLEAHRPMGRINRIRRDSYDLSARFRARVNQCPMHEPTAAELEALV